MRKLSTADINRAMAAARMSGPEVNKHLYSRLGVEDPDKAEYEEHINVLCVHIYAMIYPIIALLTPTAPMSEFKDFIVAISTLLYGCVRDFKQYCKENPSGRPQTKG